MKIALAQQNYHIGNFESNVNKIIDAIKLAKEAGAELVVFSELCICGYPPRDFLEFSDFINQSYAAIDVVREHADTIGVLIGAPARNPDPQEKTFLTRRFYCMTKRCREKYIKPCCLLTMFLMRGVILSRLIPGMCWNLKAGSWR